MEKIAEGVVNGLTLTLAVVAAIACGILFWMEHTKSGKKWLKNL